MSGMRMFWLLLACLHCRPKTGDIAHRICIVMSLPHLDSPSSQLYAAIAWTFVAKINPTLHLVLWMSVTALRLLQVSIRVAELITWFSSTFGAIPQGSSKFPTRLICIKHLMPQTRQTRHEKLIILNRVQNLVHSRSQNFACKIFRW